MKKYKPFNLGFFVGFLGTFLATFGLLFQFVELFTFFFLGITRFIIMPLLPLFTNLPGAVNMLLLAIINGAVYGLIFEAVARIVQFLQKRG
jgi:hypothetical protein